MASQVLRSICPPLFRPSTSGSLAEACIKPRIPRSGFRTLPAQCRPEVVNQRYGSANEPLPPQLGGDKPVVPRESAEQRASSKAKPGAAKAEAKTIPQDISNKKDKQLEETEALKGSALEKSQADEALSKQPLQPERSTSDEKQESTTSDVPNALGQIMRMEPNMSEDSEEKPPHLQAPPYVHHFDSFTLVRALEKDGGFTEDQAVTAMKAVRLILADNMDLARDGIVAKGDAEMAAYLFRAATAELRTEVKNNRSSLTERMRSERTLLQHEVDILAQRITADTATLKDELKAMFDDRKMAVRMERREVENKIQELNYRIASHLNSEVRTEAEGLRWVLVRRAVTALVVVVVSVVGMLSLNSKQKRAEDEAEKKRAKSGSDGDASGGDGGMRDDAGRSLKAADIVKGLENGGDPSLVSLG